MRTLVIAAALGAAITPAIADTSEQAAPTVQQLARARSLYLSAEQQIRDGNYGAAAAQYTKAFDLSHDSVLLFKIASAHQRSGRCDVAIRYYQRYLADASPNDEFVTLTNERIVACKGDPNNLPPLPPAVTTKPKTDPASPERRFVKRKPNDNLAWIIVGGGIAFLTVGGVLAYSADAAENDVDDLYAGLGGTLPEFDEQTRAEYDELIEEGERYERLAWISFGLAAISGGVATYLFWKERQPSEVMIAPTATRDSAGLSATLRW